MPVSLNSDRFTVPREPLCPGLPYSKHFISEILQISHLFQKSCRLAINSSLNENFKDCDTVFRQRRIGAFWRKIKKSRSNDCDNFISISIDSLENRFRVKFAYNFNSETDFINAARREVNDEMNQCEDSNTDFIFTERMLQKYISVLKATIPRDIWDKKINV